MKRIFLLFVAFLLLSGVSNMMAQNTNAVGKEKTRQIGERILPGMTFFDEVGEILEEKSFQVFQALDDGVALASGKGNGYSVYLGITALLYNKEGTPYYDEQVINASKHKCFRVVGIYKYTTRRGDTKTVPIVVLMDK